MNKKRSPSLGNDRFKEDHNELVISYLTLRNLIGFGGMLLPLVLALWPTRPGPDYGFEPSISDYFFTDRGDVLVVLLSVLAVFLLTYAGYTWLERGLTILAAICALGIAFVPTLAECKDCVLSVHTAYGGIFHNHLLALHLFFAGIFLLCLATISLKYFRMKDDAPLRSPEGKKTQKARRNTVYTICGWTMICCVSALGVYFLIKKKVDFGHFPVIYTFETIAVEAFGFAWLTKGETLWPDGEHYLFRAMKEFKHRDLY